MANGLPTAVSTGAVAAHWIPYIVVHTCALPMQYGTLGSHLHAVTLGTSNYDRYQAYWYAACQHCKISSHLLPCLQRCDAYGMQCLTTFGEIGFLHFCYGSTSKFAHLLHETT
jgi:hypothetical protein